MTQAEPAELERLIQMRTASKGSPIMDPNRPARVVYFVQEGHVRLYKIAPDGRPFVVALPGPGNLFGETEALSNATAHLFAQTVDDVLLCAMTRPLLQELIRRKPELAIKLVETRTARLREAEAARAPRDRAQRSAGYLPAPGPAHARLRAGAAPHERGGPHPSPHAVSGPSPAGRTLSPGLRCCRRLPGKPVGKAV